MPEELQQDTAYTPPVSQLLSLGDVRNKDQLDYLALGFGPEHVPELNRMILDEDLWWADSEAVEVWSAVHAWRALAQIGAPDAIKALLTLMGRIDEYDDDWTMTELPDVFAAIGPVAIPHLAQFLADDGKGMWARITCINCFEHMAGRHPDTRQKCIDIITNQLGQFERQSETLNAFLISILIDWKVVEAAPLMEQAFNAQKVDLSLAGDWEAVQIELGLLDERITPAPNFTLASALEKLSTPREALPPAITSRLREVAVAKGQRSEQRSKAKAKKKRKQQKRSRRKQRK